MDKNTPDITDVLKRHPADRGSLIPLLQDIQQKLGYLSEGAINEVERYTGISANEIYGVATFYTQFRFEPAGEHTVCVCQGTACHVRGGQLILREVEQQLGIKTGQTTSDGKFSLERVACLGCCALAPVVTVNGKVYSAMTTKKIPSLIQQHRNKKKVCSS